MSRNNGIITNFCEDATVEVSGTAGKDGAHPYKYGWTKSYLYKVLMEGQYAYERLTVEACLESKIYVKALQAFNL